MVLTVKQQKPQDITEMHMVNASPPPSLLGWSGEIEVGASLPFGNTEQKIASSRASVTRTEATTELDGEARVNAVFGYRPEFDAFDRFTLASTNSFSCSLSNNMSLKLTFIDSYDSQAEDRGAPSNNDGQVVFGLLSTF